LAESTPAKIIDFKYSSDSASCHGQAEFADLRADAICGIIKQRDYNASENRRFRMNKIQKLFVLTASLLMMGSSISSQAAETSHGTSTHGQDTRMGRTTGNDTITDGTFSEPTVTIRESDDSVRQPSSTTSSADRFIKH
jgi:hypothetical protein